MSTENGANGVNPVDELWEKHGEFFARVGIDQNLPVPDQLKQVREIVYGERLLSKMHKALRGLLLSGVVSLTGRDWRAVIVPKKRRSLVPILDAEDILPPEEFEKIVVSETINFIEFEPVEKKKQRAAEDALIAKSD
jgi:hypothetical protein